MSYIFRGIDMLPLSYNQLISYGLVIIHLYIFFLTPWMYGPLTALTFIRILNNEFVHGGEVVNVTP